MCSFCVGRMWFRINILTIYLMTGMDEPNTFITATTTHHHLCRHRQSLVIKWRLNHNEPILIISLASTGTLCPNLNYTSAIRGKSCYFIKKQPQALNIDDIHSVGITVQIITANKYVFMYVWYLIVSVCACIFATLYQAHTQHTLKPAFSMPKNPFSFHKRCPCICSILQ